MSDIRKACVIGGVAFLILVGLLVWILVTRSAPIEYRRIERAFSAAVQKIPKPAPIDYQEIKKVLEEPFKAMKAATNAMENAAKNVNEAVKTMKKPQDISEEAPTVKAYPPVPYPKEFKVDRSKGVRIKVLDGTRLYMFFVLLDSKQIGSKFQEKLAKEKLMLMKAGKNTAEIQKDMNKIIAESGDSEGVYRVEGGPYTPAVFDKNMKLLKNSPLLGIKGMIGWAPDEEGKLWLNTADEDFLFSIDYRFAELGPSGGLSHLSEDVKKVLRKYNGR